MCSKCFFKWGGKRKVFLSFNGVMWFVNWYFFLVEITPPKAFGLFGIVAFSFSTCEDGSFLWILFLTSAAECLRIWLNWENAHLFSRCSRLQNLLLQMPSYSSLGCWPRPYHSFKLSLSLSRASCKSLPQRVASWKMSSCVSMYLVTYSSLCLINTRYQLCSKVWYTYNYIWILLIQEIFCQY